MENILNEPALQYNYISAEEYLDLERKAWEKHEFMNGEIIKMNGASLKHCIITGNLIAAIALFLKGKNAEVFPSNLRLYIPAAKIHLPTPTLPLYVASQNCWMMNLTTC